MKSEKFLKKIIGYAEKNGEYAFVRELTRYLGLNDGEFNRLRWANEGCSSYDLVDSEPRIKINTARCRENLSNFPSGKLQCIFNFLIPRCIVGLLFLKFQLMIELVTNVSVAVWNYMIILLSHSF